jgi:hypothetical protein
MGNNQDPITLHKYLYANADPGNMVDPSGRFSLGSVMSAVNSISTLTTVAQTTYNVFQIATGEEEVTAKKLGSAILFNMIGAKAGKVLGLFNKAFAKEFKAVCGRNSFSPGTLVHAEDGLRPIEEISIGDLVWATNPETSEQELKTVTHLIQGDREYELFLITFENGEVITVTADHSFFSEDQWINAQVLKVGNRVSVFSDSESSIIVSIEKEVKEEKVFNLTVDGLHTFYVGEAGYLVHNTNIFCSKNITAVFPRLEFRGLVKGRRLKDLTGNEISNAFSQTGYRPSSHAIMRIKHKRTGDLGFKTLDDIAKVINKGTKFDSRDGTVGFRYKGLEAIINPKSMIIITIKPM